MSRYEKHKSFRDIEKKLANHEKKRQELIKIKHEVINTIKKTVEVFVEYVEPWSWTYEGHREYSETRSGGDHWKVFSKCGCFEDIFNTKEEAQAFANKRNKENGYFSGQNESNSAIVN